MCCYSRSRPRSTSSSSGRCMSKRRPRSNIKPRSDRWSCGCHGLSFRTQGRSPWLEDARRGLQDILLARHSIRLNLGVASIQWHSVHVGITSDTPLNANPFSRVVVAVHLGAQETAEEADLGRCQQPHREYMNSRTSSLT